MPLTPTHVQQYLRDGWCAVPDFFDASEVAALQAEVDRLQAEGLLRNVATEGDGKTRSSSVANLQICPASPKSELIRALPYARKVVEAVRGFVGDPVTFWLDQIFLKPGGHGAGTSWHQDNAYFKADQPVRGVGMWTAVHRATVANGTMHIVPGLGQKLEHRRDPGSDHHIRCWVDESKAIPVELPAGGVLFFAFDIPHCTRANTTASQRAGLALHFAHADQCAFADVDRYRTAPHLTGPKADHGVERWGRDLRGEWERLVRPVAAAAST